MKHHHISPLRFVSLLLNDDALADGDARSPLFFNLTQAVAQCRRCRREVLSYFEFNSMEELEGLDSPALDLVERREEVECRPILAWLDHLPAGERLAAEKDPACLRPRVVEGLLARCRQRWSEAPREALADAQLATRLARHLSEEDESFLPEFDQSPLLARAWGVQGNVLRILGELPAAARALARAGEWAARGVVGKPVRAELLSFSASLAMDRSRFQEAQNCLDEAARLYAGLAAWHEFGRVLLQTAKVELKLGAPGKALVAVQRALVLLDAEREPEIRFGAASIHLHLLCILGRHDEAATALPEARRLCRLYGSSLDEIRLRWCKGLIEAGLEPPEVARQTLLCVRRAFLTEGIASDVALVTLDLAALYAAEGRWGEIAPLAAEVVPVLRVQGIEREALAALLLVAEANERQLAAGLVAEARRRIESGKRK